MWPIAIQTEQRGLSVRRSVCLSVATVSPAKTAEPIEMPFGVWTRVGQRNYVLDRGHDPYRKGNFLRGMTSGVSAKNQDIDIDIAN